MFNSLQKTLGKAASSVAAATSTPPQDGSSGEDDMDELAEASRVDLLQRIQDLTERNERLERRFRDVVGAYKNVLTEKAALEDTVAALTSGATAGNSGATAHTEIESNGSNGESVVSSAGDNQATAALQQKVESLGKAVATLTEEKKAIVERYQSDKKIVAETHRTQLEEQENTHKSAIQRLAQSLQDEKAEKLGHIATVNQLSEQLRAGHTADKQREEEWERERQTLVRDTEARLQQAASDSKIADKVFKLKEELQSARDAELDALTQLSSTSSELKDKIANLEEELATATKKLVSAESTGDSGQVLDLKQEVSRLQRKCSEWQLRAENAEVERLEASKVAQDRIAESDARLAAYLATAQEDETEAVHKRVQQENRLGELASIVGQYEAARVTDSNIIIELRDEIADLRQQLRVSNAHAGEDALKQDQQPSAATAREEELTNQVAKLKSMLDIAKTELMESPSRHVDDTLADDLPVPSWSRPGVEVAQDPEKIKNEGEAYYRNAQSAYAKLAKIQGELARSRAAEREASSKLRSESKSKEEAVQAAVEQLKCECASLQDQLRAQAISMQEAHTRAVEDLKAKTLKMRDRALALVRDRDIEIARLRQRLQLSSPVEEPSLTSPEDLTDGAESIRQLGVRKSVSGRTVHDAVGQRFGNKEISMARVKIRELEGTVLDMREQSTHFEEQASALKEEIRRLERNARREGANLEYLKNILVNYMSNKVGREQSMKAVATILQFSPKEIQEVEAAQVEPGSFPSATSWWPGSPTK